jgi:hypothetical protein
MAPQELKTVRLVREAIVKAIDEYKPDGYDAYFDMLCERFDRRGSMDDYPSAEDLMYDHDRRCELIPILTIEDFEQEDIDEMNSGRYRRVRGSNPFERMDDLIDMYTYQIIVNVQDEYICLLPDYDPADYENPNN